MSYVHTWATGSDDRGNPIPRIDINKLIDWLIDSWWERYWHNLLYGLYNCMISKKHASQEHKSAHCYILSTEKLRDKGMGTIHWVVHGIIGGWIIRESEMSVSRRGGQSGKTGNYRNYKTGFFNRKPVDQSCKPIVLVCSSLNCVVLEKNLSALFSRCCYFTCYVSLFSLKKTPPSNSLRFIL